MDNVQIEPVKRQRRGLPQELNILLVLVAVALVFEILGWIFQGQSFLMNSRRLTIMILQVSVVGIIAIGVTQVIITGGIDLSSGSVVAMTAMITMSVAQSGDYARAMYPALTDLPVIVPLAVGLGLGLIAGMINGALIALTGIPPFIATLGMMVTARGIAKWYTKGQPISFPTDGFATIGSGAWPVFIFLAVALIFHIALRYTRYGKYTYAIGANPAGVPGLFVPVRCRGRSGCEGPRRSAGRVLRPPRPRPAPDTSARRASARRCSHARAPAAAPAPAATACCPRWR